MARDRQFERRAEITAALEGLIGEEETVTVRGGPLGLEVRFSDDASFRERYPDLAGTLLAMNAQLDETGGGVIVAGVLAAVAASVAIHRKWIARIGDVRVENLQSFGVYFLFVAGAFVLGGFYSIWAKARVYRNWKLQLIEIMEREKITRARLLSQLEGDAEFKDVCEQIKKDTDVDFR